MSGHGIPWCAKVSWKCCTTFCLPPVASRGGGQGEGLVPRGPGQLWGPGTSWIIFYFFLIGSQWGIQDFDKGGPPKKKIGLATLGMIWLWLYYTYTHTQHTHNKIIAILTRVYICRKFPKDLSNPDALRTEIDLMSQDIQHVCPQNDLRAAAKMMCGQWQRCPNLCKAYQ